MLRFLREKGNTLILKGLLAFVALTFISWGGFTLSRGPAVPGGRVAAWVNDTPITVQEFERRYFQQAEEVRRQLGSAYTEEVAQQLGLRQQTFSNLVMEKLQLQEAERLRLLASDVEVALRIQELPYFQRNGQFDKRLYRQVLAVNRLNPRQFEEDQRRLIALDRLRRYVGMGASVSEQEVRDLYRWRNERIKLEAIRIPPSLFAKEVQAGEDDLKKFFEKNKGAFRVGPQRRAEWWYLPFEAVAGRVSVSEEELRARYEETRARYVLKGRVSVNQILIKLPPDAGEEAVKKARAKLSGLRARILRGESFEALARKHSEGPAASKGGDLGTLGRGEMVPDIEKVAFSLKKGEVSEPVRSGFGLHLVRVRDRQASRQQRFEEVRAEVEKDLRQRKARERARSELRKVRYQVEDGKPAPEVQGLRKGVTRFFERSRPPASVPEGKVLAELAFGLGERGAISREKEGGEGMMFVRLLETKESFIPPLEEVRAEVRRAYVEQKSAEIARREAEAWRRDLEGGGRTLEGLAKELGLEVLSPEPFPRTAIPPELGDGPEVARAAFGLEEGKFARAASGRDVLLLRGMGAPTLDMSKFAEQREDLRRRILDEKRALLFLRYMEVLRQAAKVRLEEGFSI